MIVNRLRFARAAPALITAAAMLLVGCWHRKAGPPPAAPAATVREIVDDVGKRRDLAYTTVMTIMSRLHEKGLLARERDGKGYVYRPAFSREEHRARLSRELVRGLVDEFGDVALAQFAAELDTVDASHRSALKKLAAKGTRDAR